MDKPHIIIDLGSSVIKAGFAGEEGPRAVFPAVVGRPKAPGIELGSAHRDYYVGREAEEKREVLTLEHPIEHAIVEDWDDLEKLLDHTFTNELRVNPEEHHVLVTEPPVNPKSIREKLTQMMFDTFNVSGLYISVSSVLPLYSVGKFTGLVVESGDSVTHVVPIVDEHVLPHGVLRFNNAGRDLTHYLVRLLNQRGLHLTTSAERRIVEDVKKQTCYVALDFEDELARAKQGFSKRMNYEMPDGTVITLASERFQTPEALFQPSLIGKELSGLHELVYQSIQKSDEDVRNDLYQNIVVSGGTTLFPGLPERLTNEVRKLAPPEISSKVKVIAVPEREHTAWIGGSILSSMSQFFPRWITNEEYQEAGPEIVHRKCY